MPKESSKRGLLIIAIVLAVVLVIAILISLIIIMPKMKSSTIVDDTAVEITTEPEEEPKPIYSDVNNLFVCGLAPVRNGDELYGYIDNTGTLVIDYQFYYADGFSENGLAAVTNQKDIIYGILDDQYETYIELYDGSNYDYDTNSYTFFNKECGYINTSGEYVIEPQYKDIGKFQYNGLAKFSIDGEHWGLINEENNIVVNPIYTDITDYDKNGIAIAKDGEKATYLDENAEVLFVIDAYNAYPFSDNKLSRFEIREGLITSIPSFGYEQFSYKYNSHEYNYETDTYSFFNSFYGFVDMQGNVVIEPTYEMVNDFADNGLALFEIGEKFGYIDGDGKIAINPQFDGAQDFMQGLAAVKFGEKWGFIDETGSYAINPQFGFTYGFSKNGLCSVYLEGKYGYIDKSGQYVINPQFDYSAESFEGSYAAAGMGIINESGKYIYISTLETIQASIFDDGYFIVYSMDYSQSETVMSVVNDQGNTIYTARYRTLIYD